MNKLELAQQENEPNLNIKSCLVMSLSSANVWKKKLNEQVWIFNTRLSLARWQPYSLLGESETSWFGACWKCFIGFNKSDEIKIKYNRKG